MKAVIGQKHPYKAKKSRKELSYWKNCIIKVAQQPHKPIGGSNQIWATTSFKNICHSNLWLLSWGCKRQQLIAIPESLHVSQECLWACGRGDVSTPSFGSYLNPISTRRADYAHLILVSTPSLKSHRRACFYISWKPKQTFNTKFVIWHFVQMTWTRH